MRISTSDVHPAVLSLPQSHSEIRNFCNLQNSIQINRLK